MTRAPTRVFCLSLNDQAWVEQKNGAIVRRLVGYGRLEGMVSAQALVRLYAAARLHTNLFQPSMSWFPGSAVMPPRGASALPTRNELSLRVRWRGWSLCSGAGSSLHSRLTTGAHRTDRATAGGRRTPGYHQHQARRGGVGRRARRSPWRSASLRLLKDLDDGSHVPHRTSSRASCRVPDEKDCVAACHGRKD